MLWASTEGARRQKLGCSLTMVHLGRQSRPKTSHSFPSLLRPVRLGRIAIRSHAAGATIPCTLAFHSLDRLVLQYESARAYAAYAKRA